MLTGRAPYTGDEPAQLLASLLHDAPPPALHEKSLSTTLILYAEHEFNASTFAQMQQDAGGAPAALELLEPGKNRDGRRALERFVEPRWFHQVIGRARGGSLSRAIDLEAFLAAGPGPVDLVIVASGILARLSRHECPHGSLLRRIMEYGDGCIVSH